MVEQFLSLVDRKVRVVIVVNGINFLTNITDLISLNFIDNIGAFADELSFKVVNSYFRPKVGEKLELYIGFAYYGSFIVKETTRTKKELTVKATSANFGDKLKEKKSRAWDKIKLCDLIAKIAKEHKLKHKCNIKGYIVHLAQDNESDLNLLSKLAKQYHARFNIKNETLIFIEFGLDGVPEFAVIESECESYSITHTTKPAYKSAKAIWHDTKENKAKKVVVGKGEPQLILRNSYKNEAEARDAAKAALKNITQGTVKGRLSIYGQEIRSGGVLNLIGFLEEDGKYSIDKVTHSIDSRYITNVEFSKI
jgi:phage protein D